MMEWLEQHSGKNEESETGELVAVTFHETMEADHIVPIRRRFMSIDTTFAVSEMSGSVGISSLAEKPSVSVIFPGTDKPAHFLSRNEKYTSSLFLTISGEEFLVAASRCRIQIWSLAKDTSAEMYKFEETGFWRLCKIDERTVACVGLDPSSDGFSKVCILNTGSQKFNLSGTLQVKPGGTITDMCHMKTADGTPCLLLSFPRDNVVECVEMVGGRVRWQVDKKQIGGSSGMRTSFRPWSICTDGNTVFIVDPFPGKLHLLSVEDGSVLTSNTLHQFGIDLPCCVCLHGNYLLIGHLNKTKDTYCISKFTKKF